MARRSPAAFNVGQNVTSELLSFFNSGRRVTLLAVLCLTQTVDVAAKELFLSPDQEVKPLLKQVVAGDVVVLKNGTWSDADLKFELLPGTSDQPIVIRAETPGQVFFYGRDRVSVLRTVCHGFGFRISKFQRSERRRADANSQRAPRA
ncbi:MAG: chondroitinase-B domain-containing protein [Planctomycetales bacterium]